MATQNQSPPPYSCQYLPLPDSSSANFGGGPTTEQTTMDVSTSVSPSASPSPSPGQEETVFIVNTGKRAKRLSGNIFIQLKPKPGSVVVRKTIQSADRLAL